MAATPSASIACALLLVLLISGGANVARCSRLGTAQKDHWLIHGDEEIAPSDGDQKYAFSGCARSTCRDGHKGYVCVTDDTRPCFHSYWECEDACVPFIIPPTLDRKKQ
ncbi:hypothetical protein MLD38_020979 [Melastoma candidum]|uniref:Uncharacterized protein n=1 Tax=Melastoma candidum TaxID=119954 RepID=A0ACB9QE51_9MYRT|nr:hypothetical protein MLD38_020979 [Melastoma candidum]